MDSALAAGSTGQGRFQQKNRAGCLSVHPSVFVCVLSRLSSCPLRLHSARLFPPRRACVCRDFHIKPAQRYQWRARVQGAYIGCTYRLVSVHHLRSAAVLQDGATGATALQNLQVRVVQQLPVAIAPVDPGRPVRRGQGDRGPAQALACPGPCYLHPLRAGDCAGTVWGLGFIFGRRINRIFPIPSLAALIVSRAVVSGRPGQL